MKKHKNPTLLLLLFLTTALLAGCKKEVITDDNPEPSQDTPIIESYYTDYDCLYMIVDDDSDGYYAMGKGKETDYLLHLDANGVVTNQSSIGFRSTRCLLKSSDRLIVVGAGNESSGTYTMNTRGWMAAFDHSLNKVCLLNVTEDNKIVELNSIAQDPDDPELFYAGGFVNVVVNGAYQQQPYICTVRFDGTRFDKVASRVFPQYDHSRFVGLLVKQQDGQKDLIMEMLRYQTQYNPVDWHNTLHLVKLNFFNESNGWGHDIWNTKLEGLYDMKYYEGDDYVSDNGFDSDDNNVYVFGRVYDEKDFLTASGGQWRSGCVVAINWHDGQIQWTQKLCASKRDDDFYNGKLFDGYLYVCGRHSGVYYSDIDKYLGNGLLAKLSVSGTIISHKTFGQKDRYSWLIKPTKNSKGEIVCVGVSGDSIGRNVTEYTGKFYGWFLKTNL